VSEVTAEWRAALESGEFDGFARRYADDAKVEVSVRGRRSLVSGPGAAKAEFEKLWPTPGRLLEFSPAEHEHGVAIWLERLGDDGAPQRQRHYLHVNDGTLTGHWIYGARPGHPEVVPPDESGPMAPTALFEPLGSPAASQEVMVSTGWSGNRIERATLEDGRALVCKRIVPEAGWLERLSEDRGREGILFAEGAFDRMPPELDPTIVSALREDDGAWWIAMRDVSEHLFGGGSEPITREQHRRVMECANAMWEAYWGEEVPGTVRLEVRLGIVAPAVAEQERKHEDFLPKQVEAAWEAFAEAADDDVADAVLAVYEDLPAFAAEIEKHGTTLIHGDLRDEQIGLDGETLVVVDWGAATQGHPVVELAWYMMHDVWRIEATHDEVVEDFRRARGERDDPAALDLGIISGLVMYGWILGHSAVIHTDEAERAWAREELDWWVPRVRQALERTWSPGRQG
jgi:hypothetical protein